MIPPPQTIHLSVPVRSGQRSLLRTSRHLRSFNTVTYAFKSTVGISQQIINMVLLTDCSSRLAVFTLETYTAHCSPPRGLASLTMLWWKAAALTAVNGECRHDASFLKLLADQFILCSHDWLFVVNVTLSYEHTQGLIRSEEHTSELQSLRRI